MFFRFWQRKQSLSTQERLDKDDPNGEGTSLDGGYSKIFEIKNYSNSTPSVDVAGADLIITGAYLILPITK